MYWKRKKLVNTPYILHWTDTANIWQSSSLLLLTKILNACYLCIFHLGNQMSPSTKCSTTFRDTQFNRKWHDRNRVVVGNSIEKTFLDKSVWQISLDLLVLRPFSVKTFQFEKKWPILPSTYMDRESNANNGGSFSKLLVFVLFSKSMAKFQVCTMHMP